MIDIVAQVDRTCWKIMHEGIRLQVFILISALLVAAVARTIVMEHPESYLYGILYCSLNVEVWRRIWDAVICNGEKDEKRRLWCVVTFVSVKILAFATVISYLFSATHGQSLGFILGFLVLIPSGIGVALAGRSDAGRV